MSEKKPFKTPKKKKKERQKRLEIRKSFQKLLNLKVQRNSVRDNPNEARKIQSDELYKSSRKSPQFAKQKQKRNVATVTHWM